MPGGRAALRWFWGINRCQLHCGTAAQPLIWFAEVPVVCVALAQQSCLRCQTLMEQNARPHRFEDLVDEHSVESQTQFSCETAHRAGAPELENAELHLETSDGRDAMRQ